MHLESARSGADCVTFLIPLTPRQMLAAGMVQPCLTGEMTEAQWGYKHFHRVIGSGGTKF